MSCILLKGKLLSTFNWHAVMSKTYHLGHEYTSIHLIWYLRYWFLGWRLVLLAYFMNSEFHLYSKISKQWLFIRCTKKMLIFYRNCCIHFTEVTGRAHFYFFLVPICHLLWAAEGGTRRFTEVPCSLNCSVILCLGGFMHKLLVEENAVF